MKVHLHDEQFDSAMHAWCGRGNNAVVDREFEATPRAQRCDLCDREWFPFGQPDWHYALAVKHLTPKATA